MRSEAQTFSTVHHPCSVPPSGGASWRAYIPTMIPGDSHHHQYQHLYSNHVPPGTHPGATQHLQQPNAQASASTSAPSRPIVPHTPGQAVHHHPHHGEHQQELDQPPHEYRRHQEQMLLQQHRPDLPYPIDSIVDDSAQFHQETIGNQGREEGTQGGRAYRSRKERPCDTCRKRKSRCIIEEAGQDCQSCRMNGRECTFNMSPTPRSRPLRDQHGVVIASRVVPRKRSHSKEKAEASRSPSTSFAQSSDAGKSRQEPDAAPSMRVMPHRRENSPAPMTSEVETSSSTLHQSSSSVATRRSFSILPPSAMLPPVSAERHTNTTGLPVPLSTPGSFERRQSAFLTPAVPETSFAALRRASTASSTFGEVAAAREDVPRSSEKATSDQLYGYLSEVMHGKGRAMDAAQPASSPLEEEHTHSGPQLPQDEKEGMMPVVLGSSSSEDPHLLRQAGSPPPSRQGRPWSPSNDHVSVASSRAVSNNNNNLNNMNLSRDMPPPPTPDTQSSTGTRSNFLGPLQIRQVTNDPHRPIFFAYVPANPYGRNKGKGRDVSLHGLAKLMKALHGRIGPLMVLYSQRDAAAFPLLTETQRRKFRETAVEALASGTKPPDIPLPAVLATATLATPTVYDVSLRPISKHAWGANLHALKLQFETSTLATLQVALTDLTGRPSINTSGNFMTFNQTLAISHMLGLHLDPSGWNLTREEKDVRIRLWWATMIHDKWSSLCWGRPSTIHRQDFSVPLPRRSNLSPCQEHLEDRELATFSFGRGWAAPAHAHTPGDTFAGLCRLTLILGDILDEFHSVRSVHILHRDAFGVAERVKGYFVAIEEWLDALPETLRCVLKNDEKGGAGAESIPGTRSLQLSYLGVQLLLCRTTLDAVTTKGTQDLDKLVPAHKTALHAALMCVQFLESLSADDFGGFFLHYGAHHLASCLSLLARLCFGFSHVNEHELLADCIGTLQRLLVVLSESHRLYKWDMAELALTRSRAILPSLEMRIDDFPKMFPAEYEHGPVQPEASSPSPFIATDADAGGGSNERCRNPSQCNSGAADSLHSTSAKDSRPPRRAAIDGQHEHQQDGQDRQIRDWRASANESGASGSGGGAAGPDRSSHSSRANASGHLYDYRPLPPNNTVVSVPFDAAGLPYPLSLNNADTLSYLSSSLSGGVPTMLHSGVTSGASHLLSSMEVDWLGMGLGPDTYPDYFSAPGPPP